MSYCLSSLALFLSMNVMGPSYQMKKIYHPIISLVSSSIHFDNQAACPPALLSHRLMSQGREEERRRMEEERRRGEEENLRRQEKRRGEEERPLYESIYSLAGSPGGICSPSTKTTLDQLHPLQLQVAPPLFRWLSCPIFFSLYSSPTQLIDTENFFALLYIFAATVCLLYSCWVWVGQSWHWMNK